MANTATSPKAARDTEDRTRDRSRTEDAILRAARRVLIESGFAGWGVNALARAAGCDKQLIYRYFGGLDGLAEALGTEVAHDLEAALSEVRAPPVTSYAGLVAAMLEALLQVLRSHPVMQRIIAAELSEASSLTAPFAEARGRALGAWVAKIKGDFAPPHGVDAPAINAVLIAAVQQMVLSSASVGGFAGMPLAEAEDWERLRRTLRRLVVSAYADPCAPD
ncbi:MAG: hypothetical protein B7Z08_01585 [Sphingomonadales bacterium 32-68-7]|nr:MAG: hypothetical protein B7Z33_00425 [Sphingomonadales bacterium 12-68-11]OYX10271.1 MAG: hypothetical protein B7Z08_01585 [Sphingomonadales bacterium 32-68-7]